MHRRSREMDGTRETRTRGNELEDKGGVDAITGGGGRRPGRGRGRIRGRPRRRLRMDRRRRRMRRSGQGRVEAGDTIVVGRENAVGGDVDQPLLLFVRVGVVVRQTSATEDKQSCFPRRHQVRTLLLHPAAVVTSYHLLTRGLLLQATDVGARLLFGFASNGAGGAEGFGRTRSADGLAGIS